MSTGTAPICFDCAHFRGVKPPAGWICQAFPNGIPIEILVHAHDHHEPFRGDGGMTFAPLGASRPGAVHVHFHDRDKLSKTSVGFEHPAQGRDHCADCTHFAGRDSCEIVAGRVEPEDWCRRFLVDQLGGNRRRDSSEFDEFRETEHPRDPGGMFTIKGGGGSREALVKHGETGREQLPAHIQALKIPPAWTNLAYNPDPDGALLVTGRDAKGRVQAIYSKRFAESQAAVKFARIQDLASQFDRVEAENEKARRSRDPRTRDSADCLALIMHTGIRPGSASDTKASVKAYGATTLEGKHVERTGDGSAMLSFVGKKGVPQRIRITDQTTAAMLLRRARQAGPDGKLFPNTSSGALLQHTHQLDGGSFKTKDFRTLLGTTTALAEIARMRAPQSFSAYKKAVRSVAVAVSQKLGNTPVVALQSYINPAVFAEWRLASGQDENAAAA